ncbi:MAG: thiamine phosphate synthase [Acidobacteria bacterium]|nr:thiamine phosphate synthase [Acidobacteriota bacterium]
MILPKIYPITDPRLTALSHTAQVKSLIEGGAEMIQLREKTATTDIFYADTLSAVTAAEFSKAKIIVNDRVDIALAAKAAGVHLGQDDLPPEEARRILGDDAVIGYSTHNPAQAMGAVELPIDYIAIGPVFETSTKKNADPAVGIEGVRRVREAVKDFPIVAIGGITYDNFQEILDSGADSVAIISGILVPPKDITLTFRAFTSRVKQ